MKPNKSDDASERPFDLIVRWLNWPQDKRTGLVAWYVITWRGLWMPLVYTGLVLAWVGIALANGPRQANYFWRRAT